MLRLNEIVFAASVCVMTTGYVQADVEAGEKLFKQCSACHQVGESAQHQFGPTLNGIVDRSAARTEGYEFSGAFNKAAETGLMWDDKTLDAFLTAPMQYIVGTKMAFPGVAEESDRVALIAYLKQFNQEGESTAASIIEDEPAEPVVKTVRKSAEEFDVPTHGVLHLGRIAMEQEVSAWDIDVRPDGLGLPVGSGNAIDGVELYDANCASCHGDFGEGTGRWPILAGGQDTLTEDRPEKTIGSYWPYLSTVYDYIRRAMPFGNARSLSDDDVYAITAYILYLNDLAEEDFELSSENFVSIRLPNESNFIEDNRASEAFRGVDEADVCMTDCVATPAQVTQRARVLDVTPDSE